jgi:cleavage and polyadenylation specificity factor subunit 2
MQSPSTEDIARYFQRITPLKYSQPHQPISSDFTPPLEGLVLTAYNAGHTLGGTIWHIQYGMESIIYAVDWNQARENVIGGAAWFGGSGGSDVIEPLRKPSALVCSSKNANHTSDPGGKKRRDQLLLANIRSSLAKGGTVLIPSDSSARVLELAYVLEKAWQEAGNDSMLRRARVYMASRSATTTLKHSQSLLEWMDDGIIREFEAEDEGVTKPENKRNGSRQSNGVNTKPSKPFELRYVKTIEQPRQLERAMRRAGPKVVLASDLSFSWGLSQLALREMAQKPENLVIFPEKHHVVATKGVQPPSSKNIWQILEEKEDGIALEKSPDGEQIEQIHGGGKRLNLVDVEKLSLDTNEQEIYQRYMATQRQLQSSLVSRADVGNEEAEDLAGGSSSSSSSEDSDDEHQGRALNVSAALGHSGRAKKDLSDKDLGVGILLRRKGTYDFDVRQYRRGRNATFPYLHHRKRGDDFGDYIKAEDYLRAEEKEEIDSANIVRADHQLGQKRKWQSLAPGDYAAGDGKRQQTKAGGRGVQRNLAPEDGEEESDESDYEPELQPVQGPAKAVFRPQAVTLNARLAFVDFAGLHDRRSLQNLIPVINPRKLILFGGSKAATEALAEDCKSLLAAKEGEAVGEARTDIFTPLIGQVIDASVDTNAWSVKLSRSLVKRLQWQSVHNRAVVTLAGELKGEPASSTEQSDWTPNNGKKQKLLDSAPQEAAPVPETGETEQGINPLLDVVPSGMGAATRSVAQPLHVGDMRLADLRRLMSTVGYTAEFRGEGTLVINGLVAVRKIGSGKILIEGSPVGPVKQPASRPVNNVFYDVRRTIYEGLAIIAGG